MCYCNHVQTGSSAWMQCILCLLCGGSSAKHRVTHPCTLCAGSLGASLRLCTLPWLCWKRIGDKASLSGDATLLINTVHWQGAPVRSKIKCVGKKEQNSKSVSHTHTHTHTRVRSYTYSEFRAKVNQRYMLRVSQLSVLASAELLWSDTVQSLFE